MGEDEEDTHGGNSRGEDSYNDSYNGSGGGGRSSGGDNDEARNMNEARNMMYMFAGGNKKNVRFDEATGMKKKWLKHFHQRRKFMGAFFALSSFMLLFTFGIIWSQLLWTLTFNSELAFRIVLDVHDQSGLYQEYQDFLFKSQDFGTDLTKYHIFHVENPFEILYYGYKPKFIEYGPYAYIKKSYKYDVSFTTDDSQYVTYKTWNYLVETNDPADCTTMYFNMDLATYDPNEDDCLDNICDCSDDSEMVTIMNPSYLKIYTDYGPSLLAAFLTQESFEKVRDAFADDFPVSVKGALTPDLYLSIYQYRKALYFGTTVLPEIIEAITSDSSQSDAITCLTMKSDQQANGVDCSCDIYVDNEIATVCQYGIGDFIDSLYAIDDNEASVILGITASSNPTLDITTTDGLNLWVRVSRYTEYMKTYTYFERDTDEAAYNTLMAAFCDISEGGEITFACRKKVQGISEWLDDWARYEIRLQNHVADEWISTSPDDSFVCDTRGKTCNWQLNSWMLNDNNPIASGSEYEAYLTASKYLNVSTVDSIINPNRRKETNLLSMHQYDYFAYVYEGFDYCKEVLVNGKPDCELFQDAYNYTNVLLPPHISIDEARSEADGLSNVSSVDVICGLGAYWHMHWMRNNDYVDEYTAGHFSYYSSSNYTYTSDHLEDLGYTQWGTGEITFLLYGIYSVANVEYISYWKFTDSNYYMNFMEFSSFAGSIGYPHMRIDTADSKLLLNSLANDTSNGDRFRQTIIERATTSYGEGKVNSNGFGRVGDIGFTEENFYNEFDDDTNPYFYDAYKIINQTFISSNDYCIWLNDWYTECVMMVLTSTDWVTNCEIWETLANDPSFGIVCDENNINDYSHPSPLMVGNVIEKIIYDYIYNRLFEDTRIVCDIPGKDCDYRKGGLFTTSTARNILFEGYADPFTFKVLNRELARDQRNITVTCTNNTQIGLYDDCLPMVNNLCEEGFNITHSTYGHLMTINRTGENWKKWYASEIDLPYNLGKIANPIFAMYPAELIDDEDYQKEKDCEGNYMYGHNTIGNLTTSCETKMVTGKHDLSDIGRIVYYNGNSTFNAQTNGSFNIFSTNGFQNTPYLWEGVKEYFFLYDGRFEGESYMGESSVSMFIPEELLQLDLEIFIPQDASTEYGLKYPTVRSYWDREPLTTDVRCNRYKMTEASWEKMRWLTGSVSVDSYNMTYTVPIGMTSTEYITGYPTFVGSPHHYGNRIWGGWEFAEVKGLSPTEDAHSTMLDIDPISGKTLRFRKRMQINTRLERSQIHKNVISSQGRCDVPTADYLDGAYGCVNYIPILWYGEEKTHDIQDANYFYYKFFMSPERLMTICNYALLGGFGSGGLGFIIYVYHKYKQRKYAQKIFID